MPSERSYIRGENRRLYVEQEASAYGTYEALVGADAVHVLECGMQVTVPRENRLDARPTKGVRARDTVGVLDVKWGTKHHLFPATTAGSMTSHGFHDLLRSVLPTHVAVGGVSNSYKPLSTQTGIISMTMLEAMAEGAIAATGGAANVHFSRMITGAVAQAMKITAQGGQKIIVEFNGFGKTHAQAARALANATVVGPSTALALNNAAAEANAHQGFDEGSRIMIDAAVIDDNGGVGYKVNTVTRATATLNLDAGTGWTIADAVMPWAPVESLPTTSPVAGISGSVTLDGMTLDAITGAVISVEPQHEPITDEFGKSTVPDAIHGSGPRVIRVELTVAADRALARWIGDRRRFTARNLILTLGDSSARYATFQMAQCEQDWADQQIGQSGKGTFTIPLIGLESAGDDDCELKVF